MSYKSLIQADKYLKPLWNVMLILMLHTARDNIIQIHTGNRGNTGNAYSNGRIWHTLTRNEQPSMWNDRGTIILKTLCMVALVITQQQWREM